MSLRTGLIVMLALVFGGSAAVGVNKYVSDHSRGAAGSLDAVPVVVAVSDISRGSMITAEMVATHRYPRNLQPPGALARVDDAIGRAAFIPLVTGEPVLNGKLAPRGARGGMAALVPSGLRAFAIHTPSVASSVAGFVLPGSKVDVLLAGEAKRGSVAITLVQNIEVLAVDQRIDAPADNRIDTRQLRSVTLLVTPDQAAKLGLAQNKGSLQLSLRNPQDDQLAQTVPARLSELDGYRDDASMQTDSARKLPAARETEPMRPTPPQRFLTIYRGPGMVERHPMGGDGRAGSTESRIDTAVADEFR